MANQPSQITGHIKSAFKRSPLDFRQKSHWHRDRKTTGGPHTLFLFSHLLLFNTVEYYWHMPRKPKHHSGQIRTHVSLSFTAPLELEGPMNTMAACRGMNRSQYICWLVQQDIYFQARTPQQGDGKTLLPKVPPRIRRKSS